MRHIPNMLSALRILLIPFFVWQMLAGQAVTAAIILVLSGITDFLDGLLARRFGWITPLGKVLDPAADKLTQVAVCVLFIVKLPRYWPFFALMLLREVVMILIGWHFMRKGVRLDGAEWFGKVVTALFYVIMVAVLFFSGIPHAAVLVMFGVITALAYVASLMYIPRLRQYRKVVQAANKQPHNADTS